MRFSIVIIMAKLISETNREEVLFADGVAIV